MSSDPATTTTGATITGGASTGSSGAVQVASSTGSGSAASTSSSTANSGAQKELIGAASFIMGLAGLVGAFL